MDAASEAVSLSHTLKVGCYSQPPAVNQMLFKKENIYEDESEVWKAQVFIIKQVRERCSQSLKLTFFKRTNTQLIIQCE